MLINFEEITQELGDAERDLLPDLCSLLSNYRGESNVVSSRQIEQYFDQQNISMPGVRIRKMINAIRTGNMIPLLVSNSKGYYIATTKDEAYRCIKSLRQREREIKRVADALQEQMNKSNLNG